MRRVNIEGRALRKPENYFLMNALLWSIMTEYSLIIQFNVFIIWIMRNPDVKAQYVGCIVKKS